MASVSCSSCCMASSSCSSCLESGSNLSWVQERILQLRQRYQEGERQREVREEEEEETSLVLPEANLESTEVRIVHAVTRQCTTMLKCSSAVQCSAVQQCSVT